MRQPPSGVRFNLTPGEAFALFVAWCTVGIVGLILTLLFLPWSLPFAFVGVLLGGYFTARFMSGRVESN